MLREAKKDETDLGRKVAGIMAKGELVTDEIVIGLIEKKLTNDENEIGFIFDGFPRTLAQADALGNLLDSIGQSLDHVVELYVNDEKLVQRIIGRFTCSSCGELYHKITKPPKNEGICDVCGSKDKFNFRQDDNEDSLKIRLLAYYRDTSPLIGYYHVLNKLRKINGLGSVDEIQNNIRNIIK
jgi:adenylate kinase